MIEIVANNDSFSLCWEVKDSSWVEYSPESGLWLFTLNEAVKQLCSVAVWEFPNSTSFLCAFSPLPQHWLDQTLLLRSDMGCIQCGLITDYLLLLLDVNINFVSRYLCFILHILCFSEGIMNVSPFSVATLLQNKWLHGCSFPAGLVVSYWRTNLWPHCKWLSIQRWSGL